MKRIIAVLLSVTFVFLSMVVPVSALDYEIKSTTTINDVTRTVFTKSGMDTQIVFYPSDIAESEDIYPVIAWANGTFCPPVLYYGLLRQLATGGYIVVANNCLMSADGDDQLSSLDFILAENENEDSIFYKKVDTRNIGLAGHSQGGRSSVNAAVKDERVDCVLSIAGSNFEYEAEALSTPTFFMAGSLDFIVFAPQWIETAYDVCKGPAVYALLKRALHVSCMLNPKAYSEYAIMWFDAWLKNDFEALKEFKDGGMLSNDNTWKNFENKEF